MITTMVTVEQLAEKLLFEVKDIINKYIIDSPQYYKSTHNKNWILFYFLKYAKEHDYDLTRKLLNFGKQDRNILLKKILKDLE